MRIKSALGINFKDAADYLIEETMKAHGINRRYACRLLGEALVRTCVVDEIFATEDALIIKKEDSKRGGMAKR